jgi:hypothetical protein
MKPRSGLSDRSFFLGSSAIEAESVRALTIVSSVLSPLVMVSLQSREAKPRRVEQPERRSFEAPFSLDFWATHFADVAFFPTHSVLSAAEGRLETEYMRAASDDTATARSSSAINSSPITNPRATRRISDPALSCLLLAIVCSKHAVSPRLNNWDT